MNKDKDIIVFAGPSGVGKSTLTNILLDRYDNFEFSISATTRNIRDGEIHAKDYYFLSEDEFKKKINKNDFIEWEEVYPGRYYGTLKSEIDRIIDSGNKAVFDIDVLGAINIKKIFGNQAHILFIKPETVEALEKRLRNRGSESEHDLKMRIKRFEKELAYEGYFDDVVINTSGDLESTKQSVISIIENNFKVHKKDLH